jgi:surface-anchored protein
MNRQFVLSVFVSLGGSFFGHAGLVPLREHVDLHWNHDETDGWTCEAKTSENGNDVFQELGEVVLPVDDRPSAAGGQRWVQPVSSLFAFTGVATGEPLWIVPAVQVPGQCWPGFNSYQGGSEFGAYQETDARLAPEDRALSLPWIRISYQGMTYQGAGQPAFSMWQTDSSGIPTVWFSTADSTHPDTFLFNAGDHEHVSWGFGAQGIYQIHLTASAFGGPGQTNPTGGSSPFTVIFAVGPFAQWQAGHFSGAQLANPAISGPEADPDHDGMKNLVEYAFGYDPMSGSTIPEAPGLGLPTISRVVESGAVSEVMVYPRRRGDDQLAPLEYVPQFSSSLAQGSWNQAGGITTTEDFPVEQDALNAVWEKVTSKRVLGPVAPARGFARVSVTLPP